MRRKASKSKPNSTRAVQLPAEFDARAMYLELERRVTALERQAAQDRSSDIPDWEEMMGLTEEPPKPGPKPNYRLQDLLLFRDNLVEMLESSWPLVEPACVPAVAPEALRKALNAIRRTETGQQRVCAEHLSRNFVSLVTFLRSGRFREDPRQIANAMAGVPTIGVWRSLKLGQANPCQLGIGQRALKAYIRRKHPRLFRSLTADSDLIHFANVWNSYRTNDEMISDYLADAIHRAWRSAF